MAAMESPPASSISATEAPEAAAPFLAASATCSIAAWVGSRPMLRSSSATVGQFGRAQLGPSSRSLSGVKSTSLRLLRLGGPLLVTAAGREHLILTAQILSRAKVP